MNSTISRLPTRQTWAIHPSGADAVVIAERDALGTTARVVFWPAASHGPIVGAVDRVLTALDLQASRFRSDSEISLVHAAAGGYVGVSDGLAEAISIALNAARWTGGLVDPTVCGALCALGYDRDFVRIAADESLDAGATSARRNVPLPAPGWRTVRLVGNSLYLPAGVRLDLGATGKGLGADRAARAALTAGAEGVLVSLGGDLALAGLAPAGGWPVLVADDHRQAAPASEDSSVQAVRIATGALATSSVTGRRWSRGGRVMHHIVDPRTGLPAAGPWRTVSVAAASCAEANAAATAAIVAGDGAIDWIASTALPARLVAADGGVTLLGGWPPRANGRLPASAPVMIGSADSQVATSIRAGGGG